ncbi:MAG: TatD family hydrolase [Acetivibrionales bacterium]|jgi:TatD DNase family protein
MLFDTHAHYDDSRFDEDRHEAIKRASESGVRYILNVASDTASAVESTNMAQEYEFFYAAVGVHPHYVEGMDNNTLETLERLASHKKVVAIGEIGLDYYYNNSPREDQKLWFARQISLARNLNLPIIVHNRDSHEDAMSIIKKENARQVGGVFHCYSGSAEMAKILLDNNFYISFGGPVTFKNARRVIEVVKSIPNDRLLIETDCPYLTPEPHRGKRNESCYVGLVAEKIAEIKGMSFEDIARITTENAKGLFKI